MNPARCTLYLSPPSKLRLAGFEDERRVRRGAGLGGRRNVNKMMQQVQQMQQQMQQAQEELARETVTASAGGGAVKATMTGGLELQSIEIEIGRASCRERV